MTAEEIFNKHSWEAIGMISPSKDFSLKAMEEYARLKHDEACEAQKQVCADEYVKSQLNCTTDSFRTILNAPKPEFKP